MTFRHMLHLNSPLLQNRSIRNLPNSVQTSRRYFPQRHRSRLIVRQTPLPPHCRKLLPKMLPSHRKPTSYPDLPGFRPPLYYRPLRIQRIPPHNNCCRKSPLYGCRYSRKNPLSLLKPWKGNPPDNLPYRTGRRRYSDNPAEMHPSYPLLLYLLQSWQ